jgi:sarcosine oxidase gamma subunit
VSRLDFLSPHGCASTVELVSPLRHVDLAGLASDLSALGKLEVRGDVETVEPAEGEHVLPLGPGRVLVVVEGSTTEARERLASPSRRVYDRTDALAALELEGRDLLARLTDLDPDSLPAVGSIARGVRTLIERRPGEERFRLYVPRELGHYVAEVVVDMAKGLGR